MGEKIPDLGDLVPHLGEKILHLGDAAPHLGEIIPHPGENSPHLGDKTPHLGETILHMGEKIPRQPRGVFPGPIRKTEMAGFFLPGLSVAFRLSFVVDPELPPRLLRHHHFNYFFGSVSLVLHSFDRRVQAGSLLLEPGF